MFCEVEYLIEEKSRLKRKFADKMRMRPTKSEALFRKKLSRYKLWFKFQYVISPYIVDFLLEFDTIVEIDGSSHIGREAYDKAREMFLIKQGYSVIRMKNENVSKVTKKQLYKILGKVL